MQTQPARSTVFNTIPSHDYLGLLKDEHSSKRVIKFLKLSKEEVANATGIPKASIRYDERSTSELNQRLQEIGVICGLVADYFNGDLDKTALWFKIANPALGDISPRDMICSGRYQKLHKFVLNALAGNTP